MDSVIHLRGVVSVLGRFPALAGVDLDIQRGEVVVLAGSNGAGKTTLLRLCAGLARVHQGSAFVLGHDLGADRRAVRRRVGYVGHTNALYDDLTVLENVRFWAKAAGADPATADVALDRLAVEGRLRNIETARLSAGQRRRVALSAMLARRAEVWLLDEPHTGLDSTTRDLLDGLMVEAAEAGVTVVFATHELERTASVSTRTVELAGGIVVVRPPVERNAARTEESTGVA